MADVHISIIPGDIVHVTTAPPPQGCLHWHIGPVITKGVTPMPQEITLSREQQVRLYIAPTTLAGNPAPMDGPARWTADGICTLTPIDDQSVWCVTPSTGVGDTVVNVEADADMGAGVVLLRDSALIHTTDPMAAQLGLGADAPVLKTPA